MVTTGSSLWWLLPSTVWFVGMVFSHIVFDRCVLNELVSRLRRFRKRSEGKANLYKNRATEIWGSRSIRSKALSETIQDELGKDLDKESQP